MKTFSTLLVMLFALNCFAVGSKVQVLSLTDLPGMESISDLPSDATSGVNVKDFLNMTPKSYRQQTGKRLGIKNTLVLKMAQRSVAKQFKKEQAADIPKIVYILSLLFGLGWLMMGLMDDFSGNNWWVNLLLVILLFGLGGLIHGLIKMKDYY